MSEALEAVIRAGADCLLTSGGEPNVLSGAKQLKRMVIQAGDRIPIMAGGGLRLASMAEVLEQTGLHCLHGSLTRRAVDGPPESGHGRTAAEILVADVRTAVGLMQGHFAAKMI
jgi:copper homeostasis protein